MNYDIQMADSGIAYWSDRLIEYVKWTIEDNTDDYQTEIAIAIRQVTFLIELKERLQNARNNQG